MVSELRLSVPGTSVPGRLVLAALECHAAIRPRVAGGAAPRELSHVRTPHRSGSQSHGPGQPGGPAIQPRIHRHRAHSSRPGQGRLRCRRQRSQEPRHRSSQGPPRGGEARQERSRHGDHGQASADTACQEGDRVRDRGSAQPQPQLRRHRAPPARPAARARRRRRPGAHESRSQAGRGSRGGPQPARRGRRKR